MPLPYLALPLLLCFAGIAPEAPTAQPDPARAAPDVDSWSPDRVLSADQAIADLDLARRALDTIHPGFDRYTPRAELLASFDALRAACAPGITERDFYARLSRILASIRCSHTKAEPSRAWAAWREASPTYLPARFLISDGRLLVRRSATPLLSPGDEILALGETSASALIASVFSVTPADGFTDDARRFAISGASDLDDCELDHYLPAFLPAVGSVPAMVRAAAGGEAKPISLPLLTKAARAQALAEPGPARNLDEAVSLDIRGDVAVLRIGTFVAYRKPIKPRDIYRPFFQRLADDKVGTLILDLRDNSGGSDEAAIDLARFLIAQPFTLSTRAIVRTFRFGDLADKLETWDRTLLTLPEDAFAALDDGTFELKRDDPPPFTPLEPTFTGRVIALCGPANASGATLFLAGLGQRRPVTLVGAPTGGSVAGPTAGVIFFLTLPNSGIRVRIPAIRTVTGLRSDSPDGGLAPDVLIRPTAEDVLSGRDVVLERALQLATPAPTTPATTPTTPTTTPTPPTP